MLLSAYAAHVVGARVHVPRVTLLLVLGLVCGPSMLNLVPGQIVSWFPFVAHLALAMVGFLLGERLIGRDLARTGRVVLWVSLSETIISAAVVFGVIFAISGSLALALLLGGIAPASAPAATLDIVQEGGSRGLLTETLLGVVAIDDAWGVILFSLLLVLAEAVLGQGSPVRELRSGIWEVAGAILVGGTLGLPMAWLTGRLKDGEPALAEAAGFVLLCAGVATLLHVSYLLACMVLGAVVANRAKHHSRPFHAIEGISEPFLSLFFVFAGFEFKPAAIARLGLVGVSYVLARSAALILGGRIGAIIGKAPAVVRSRIGWCLLPQAGVALGLALLVTERLPDIGQSVLPLIVASTVLFEIFGPLLTHWHLRRAGEL